MTASMAWLLLAAVHAVPALALFRPSLLTGLYRLPPESPLLLLMQHRAALFLGVVFACVWCAIDPAPRRLGVAVVAFSMVSFLVLYLQAGSPEPLRRIALVDTVGLAPLAVAVWSAFVRP
jgi:hypothetical protein